MNPVKTCCFFNLGLLLRYLYVCSVVLQISINGWKERSHSGFRLADEKTDV